MVILKIYFEPTCASDALEAFVVNEAIVDDKLLKETSIKVRKVIGKVK